MREKIYHTKQYMPVFQYSWIKTKMIFIGDILNEEGKNDQNIMLD